ncbi:hypothetical protein, partial [Streptomyces sp. SID724]
LPGITDAVVIARPDTTGGTALVGYATGSVDPADARTALAQTLPEAMIPATVVVLAEIPLTPNGKVDRAA